MAKVVLTDITNITGAESAAIAALNANWDAIIAAMDNTLSRDGTVPNTMSADLDMNGNDITNIGTLGLTTGTLVASTTLDFITVLTQSAYDALGSYDAETLYIIQG